MDYKLYYWDLPFRGVFIEMLLAEAGAKYSRHDASDIYPQRSLKITNPGIAPPYLYECRSKTYFAQMPAILMHLAREYDLLPKRAETHTLALKAILDCNDVLMEITNFNGQVMWEKAAWEEFRYGRLPDWMQTFESTGLAHGFKSGGGYLLGSTLSVADIATTALFGTMAYSFPTLAQDLQDNAPHIAKLVQRIEARDSIRALLEKRRATWERGYCGGQIERSLRALLGQ
ncbi:glutathione S-transferase family protein [Microbulbifer hydrolyticus]|uniref:Glutathione S-transferase n=1 Tax=Microbulbifer hydrolyticus TaxID=48074 RepID=A0A6P1T7L6_9GAMM|nr:glutathione S-transferase family protein [Microbulbifer hydrolyticus]MBB5211202.1 glutathione S-transferase [Microbulbifer hydrolyticus]QHQ38027.1 glutathione S-transferase [Microbulbifer hydrolyticus]